MHTFPQLKGVRGARLWGAVVVLALWASIPAASRAMTFTVANCTDGGSGSLRQAILNANASPGADVINFTVACTGGTALAPAGDYAAITEDVLVDACTAPGAACGTSGQLLAGVPLTLAVEINASAATRALRANAPNVTIRGFVVHSSTANGIIVNGTNDVIEFNYIGTDVTGMLAAGNAGDGIRLSNGATGATVRDNLIAANGDNGIEIQDPSSTGNLITLNVIGFNATQAGALGGVNSGVSVKDPTDVDNAIIANHIAFNRTAAPADVEIDLANDGHTANDSNDTDSGPNKLQNFPVLASAMRSSGTSLVGVLDTDKPNTDFRVDVYASTAANHSAENHLGFFALGTDDSGDASVNHSVGGCDASRAQITATATELDGSGNPLSTSELSLPVAASGSCVTSVYYSVGTSVLDLKSGSPTLTISNGIAALSTAQPANIGVGDEITYNGTLKAYISGRISASIYEVTTATGGQPPAVSGATVNSIKRAFNTLTAAVAGSSDINHLNTTNLVSGGYQLNWPCYNDAAMDDGEIATSGWTTGPNNYLRIFAPSETSEVGVSQRHDGTAGSGFRLRPVYASPPDPYVGLGIGTAYLRVEGIELNTVDLTDAQTVWGIHVDAVGSPSDIRLDELIVHEISNHVGGSGEDVYALLIDDGDVALSNSLLYNIIQLDDGSSSDTGAIRVNAGGNHYFHNNTVWNVENNASTRSTYGLDVRGGTVVAKNFGIFQVVSSTSTATCFSGTMTESNNVSSDASASGTGSQTNQSSYASYFVSVTPGSEDLHLKNDSFNLWGSYGTDLDGDANLPITADIDGDARDSASPDIGADEFTGVAPPSTISDVYYSVGTATADLKTGTPSLTLVSGTATLGVAQANNVGVGDEITYNTTQKVYISGRTSSTVYSVTMADGTTPIDTTSTVDSIKRAFNTLSGAEAAASTASYLGVTDLVANGLRLHFACYDDGAMNDYAEIEGWTTGVNNYIRVFTPVTSSEVGTSQRHDGTAGTGFRLVPALDVAGVTFIIITVNEEFVRLEGLELDGGSVVNARNFRGMASGDGLSSTSDIRLDRMIIHDIINSSYNQASTGGGIRFIDFNGGGLHLTNSILYDLEQKNNNLSSYQHGIRVASSVTTGDIYIHNVTMFNVKNNVSTDSVYGISISGGADPTVRNTVVMDVVGLGSTQHCYSGSFTQSYNVASDTTASGTGSIDSQTDYTAYFIDTTNGSEDLHLKGDSNTLWGGYGLDLDSDPDLPVTVDIDGDARDASTPDIGADEYVAIPGIELSLTKTDSPDPVAISSTLTYTVAVANGGSLAATSLVMTDTLPGAVSFVSASGTGWACGEAAGVVTCTMPTLAAYSAAADITITVTAPGTAQSLGNTASVAAAEVDPVPGNNGDSENTLVIVPVPDLDQSHYRWRNDDGDESAGGGVTPFEASATATTTTGSSSDGALDSMTLTPGADDYLVWFSTSVENSSGNDDTDFSLYVDTTREAASERTHTTDGSATDSPRPIASQARLLGVGATDPINVQWNTAGGTATAHERTLVALPVDPAETFEATATATTVTTSTSDVALDSMTLTPGAGDYLVWFSGSVEGDTSNEYHRVTIYVGGVAVPHTRREVYTEESITNTQLPIATHARLTGVGASDAIEVRWHTTDGDATMHERTLTVSRVSASDSVEVSAVADTQTTSGTDVLLDSMEMTPGAGDYVVWFTGSIEGSGSDSTKGVVLYANGTKIDHSQRWMFTEDSLPNSSMGVMTHAVVTGLLAGQKIDVRWQTDGGTATMHERTLVVQRMGAVGTGASFAAAEDTKIVELSKGATRRLRLEVSNEGNAASSAVTYQLQVAETADCSSGSYTAVPTDTSGHWQIVDSAFLVDAAPTTNISPGLSDANPTFVAGEVKDTGNTTSAISLDVVEFTELEFPLQATANATDGADYCFRLYDTTAGSPLDTYSVSGQARLIGADLAISKVDSPDPVAVSSSLNYTLSVSNNGPSEATNLVVSDTLTAAVTFVSASGTGWNCNWSAPTVTCTRPNLAASSSAPAITITVTTPAAPTVLNNTATVTADQSDPNLANNSDSEFTTVNFGTQVDLSLTKTDSPDPVVINSSLVYTLTVTNNSGIPGTNLVVTDTLPAGAAFVSAIGAGWGCSHSGEPTGGVVTCTLGGLGQFTVAAAINITVTAPGAATTLNNSASVTASETDPVGTNNNDNEDTTVIEGANADLTVDKTDTVDPVALGGTITYNLTAENLGPDPANNVTVVDTLPATVTFQSAGGTGWSCVPSGLTVTCTRATLGVAVAPAITVTVTAPGTDQVVTNTAVVSADESDPVASNNTDFEGTTVGAPVAADLGISGVSGPEPVDMGATLLYSLSVTNYGPATASNVIVTDTLPPSVTFLSALGIGWSCLENAGVVTCTRAVLAVGQAPSISVTVTAPGSTGTISNTASITTGSRAQPDPYAPNDSVTIVSTVRDPATIEDLCWAVSDSGDLLVSIGRSAPHTVTTVGGLGTTHVEAITFGPSPSGPLLFGADEATASLGTVSITTGLYSVIGTNLGTGGGADGELVLDDIDGLAFHPQTLELWATFRKGSDDAIIKIDYSTGLHVPDVWGPGIDYLEMDFDGVLGGAVCLEKDMDDLAISDDGRWYAQVDQSGDNQQLGEFELDSNGIPTGRFLSCVDLNDVNGVRVEDMEGTGFDQDGVMWGTTGSESNGSNDNRLWIIDPATGIATHPSTGGAPGAPFGVGGDYEGSDCRIIDGSGAGDNTVEGTVFFDDNADGLNHPTELGWANATVRIYWDSGGNGVLDIGDPLIQTTVTDATGFFGFYLLAGGPYLLDIDAATLPASTAMTTDNLEEAVFIGLGFEDPGNDFGFESTTMALISDVVVYADGGTPVVEFTTSSEVGTLGFFLARWNYDLQDWETLNEEMLPAVSAPQGGLYRFADRAWPEEEGAFYSITEVEASGRERPHGPFLAEWVDVGDREVLETRASSVARRPPAHVASRLEERRLENRRAERATTGPTELGPTWTSATTDQELRLIVQEDNLYFVSLPQLRPLFLGRPGFAQRALSGGELELTNRGRAIAWWPDPDRLGLYFFGEASQSIFSEDNVYWLRSGDGTLIDGVDGAPDEGRYRTDFVESRHFEEQAFAATLVSEETEEDFWYWAVLVGGHPTWGSKSSEVTLPEDVSLESDAHIRVRVTGVTSTSVRKEHHVEVSVNGTFLGDAYLSGRGPEELDFLVPAGILSGGVNRVEVSALLESGVPYSVLYLDAFDLEYRRRLEAENDRLRFRSDGAGPVQVSGFNRPDIQVFDISEPSQPLRVEGVQIESGFTVRFHAERAGAEYLAIATSQISRPVDVRLDAPSALLDQLGADYVVIAPAALLEGARELAATREDAGLSTLVVDLRDVYDEFNHGNASPLAIRDFVREAWYEWSIPPRYVALAGAGHFDYHDYGGRGSNLIPPMLTGSRPNGLFATDLTLGDVVGEDGVPEIAVGRIPVLSNEELLDYVDKLTVFESRGPETRSGAGMVLLLADNPDDVGYFSNDSDGLARMVPRSIRTQRIHLSDMEVEEARSALFDAVEDPGLFWINYLGHGGLDRFSGDGLLTVADVPNLGGGASIVTALTCVIGRFEVPGFPSLAEELVLAPESGAVAVFSPTGLSINRQSVRLDEALFRAVFKGRAKTLGDAVIQALSEVSGQFSSRRPFETYNIIGDPALGLR